MDIPRRDSPSKMKAYEDAVAAVRTALATKLEVSESTILQADLPTFFREHIYYAVIPTLYGDARTMKEVLPEEAITMYRQTFAAEALMDSPAYLFQSKEYRHCWRAQRVAQEGGIVLMPKQCGDAALVAAYAMEKCGYTFRRQNWYSSILSSAEQSYKYWYPRMDMAFWVMYGSWSMCEGCGRLFFNDQYFRQEVYDNQVTAVSPDLLSASRKRVPDDPAEYAPGKIGSSSQWWYLPRMYHPQCQCGAVLRAVPTYCLTILGKHSVVCCGARRMPVRSPLSQREPCITCLA